MWNSNRKKENRQKIDADFGDMLEDSVEGELCILSNYQFILTGNIRGSISDKTISLWNKEFDIAKTSIAKNTEFWE